MYRMWPLLFLSLALFGCAEAPAASDLDEWEANRVVLALERARVPSQKEADPGAEGRFRVLVGRADQARALAALRDEELPRQREVKQEQGDSLVQSPVAEHAHLVAATEARLERTLESIQGVLVAHVHVQVPLPDPLAMLTPQRARSSASVLIEHTGLHVPMDTNAVAELVAHAVSGLQATDVAVITTARAPSAPSPETSTTRVLSITVASPSARLLEFLLYGGAGVIVALVIVIGVMWRRRAASHADEVDAAPAKGRLGHGAA